MGAAVIEGVKVDGRGDCKDKPLGRERKETLPVSVVIRRYEAVRPCEETDREGGFRVKAPPARAERDRNPDVLMLGVR